MLNKIIIFPLLFSSFTVIGQSFSLKEIIKVSKCEDVKCFSDFMAEKGYVLKETEERGLLRTGYLFYLSGGSKDKTKMYPTLRIAMGDKEGSISVVILNTEMKNK